MKKLFICRACNSRLELVGVLPNGCPNCGRKNYRVLYGNRTRRHSEFCNIDGMIKENPRYSVSGAVLDEDLAKARQVHPGREWKKFGHSWRPLIRNRQDKLKYMKEAGAHEY